jgi:hypothetical protein
MTTSASTTRTALSAIAMTFALASVAQATSTRSFVASTGNDSNTSFGCTQADPCRSFMAAYGITASGGEIVALDSAGYGELTITGPISIVGAQVASVTVAASSTGITINTDNPSSLVILKNLQINGGGAANSTGILVSSGHLVLQNSTLKLLTTGLNVEGGVSGLKADVMFTDIIGNTTGIVTTGTGSTTTNPTNGSTEVFVHAGSVVANTTAYLMHSPGSGSPTILLSSIGSQGGVLTNQTGNATLITGDGTGCPCSVASIYNNTQFNSGNND